MRITFQLTLAFALVASLIGAVGYVWSQASATVSARINQIGHKSFVEMVESATMLATAQRIYGELTEFAGQSLAADHPPDVVDDFETVITNELEQLNRSKREIRVAHNTFTNMVRATSMKKDLGELASHREKWLQPMEGMLTRNSELIGELMKNAREDALEMQRYLDSVYIPFYRDTLLPFLQSYRGHNHEEVGELIGEARSVLEGANRMNSNTTLVGTFGSIMLGILLAHSIGRPIRKLSQAAERIGEGDLAARVGIRRTDEIGGFAKEFNRMTEALQQTTLSKSYVDSILQSLNEAVIVVDPELTITFCNQAVVHLLGYSAAELDGSSARKIWDQIDMTASHRSVGKTVWRRKDGGSVDVFVSSAPLRTDADTRLGSVFGATDITEQEEAARELRRSLREKEVLLKEVHHRVKNNLQIVSSLLSLEASRSVGNVPARFLEESLRRIRSMALIHEQLYLSDDVARIDFEAYVRELAEHVSSSYAAGPSDIPVDVEVSNVALTLDEAVPVGIIINELLSNAFKHAFPASANGRILVEFFQDEDQYHLRVTDNGVGSRAMEQTASENALGQRLVTSLAQQIRGLIEVSEDDGTTVSVRFPVS